MAFDHRHAVNFQLTIQRFIDIDNHPGDMLPKSASNKLVAKTRIEGFKRIQINTLAKMMSVSLLYSRMPELARLREWRLAHME